MRVAAAKLLVHVLGCRAAAGTATGAELNTLAMAYDQGRGCRPDYFRALSLLEAAASLGHEVAAATLAEETNELRWWCRAAELGNEYAKTMVRLRLLTRSALHTDSPMTY